MIKTDKEMGVAVSEVRVQRLLVDFQKDGKGGELEEKMEKSEKLNSLENKT